MDFLERSRQQKVEIKFGTCNVRSPYRSDSLRTVASELTKCNADLVAEEYMFFYGSAMEC
jgi:hypothetical protein